MKIAVASSDGKIIDQHFGQACHFLIFELGTEGIQFLELREKGTASFRNHEYRWTGALKLLKDCRVIFCRRIGDEPREKLEEMGIEVIESKKESIKTAIISYLSMLM
ncbi:MAG TPA: NifB/NifX family molybdenum-iron cluster-binding protein [Methanobacteriaceae archaeon]|nr:NifB/NifX family molybdenum-iron cluster-binding protein [Methanobacteriaceae archaeon]